MLTGPHQIAVEVDLAGLPDVLALAMAARNVVDHAVEIDDGITTHHAVIIAELEALERALMPIMPGALIDA